MAPLFKSVMITGANNGLGFETARQLATNFEGIQTIYLACRNEHKAKDAKERLEKLTGKTQVLFEIILLDTSDLESCRRAAAEIPSPGVDALVMNAGGTGGADPLVITASTGATAVMQTNILGHIVLLEELIRLNKLHRCAILSGSQLALGYAPMSVPEPQVIEGSVQEFVDICTGTAACTRISSTGNGSFNIAAYGTSKLLGAYYISSMSRKHPSLRFVTVCPGPTATDAMKASSPDSYRITAWIKSFMISALATLGFINTVEKGARRYIDVLMDNEGKFTSGTFWGSKKGQAIGEMCDQGTDYTPHLLYNEDWDDNAYEALHKFIKL